MEKRIEEMSLSEFSGITKRAITRTSKRVTEKDLNRFLFGDLREAIHHAILGNTGKQRWATPGKRCVQMEEAKIALQFFLRDYSQPSTKNALILPGLDPGHACLPWVMSGLAQNFQGYEKNLPILVSALEQKDKALELIKRNAIFPFGGEEKDINLTLCSGDCLNGNRLHREMAVIDLDFCNNILRREEDRRRVLNLINRSTPRKGSFIFRVTLHVGRVNNSKKDIDREIDIFERNLVKTLRIKTKTMNFYQSTLPMLSLMWILEKRAYQPITTGLETL